MLMQLPGVEHPEASTKIAEASSLVLFLELDEVLEDAGAWSEQEPRTLIEDLASREGVLVCLLGSRSLAEMKGLVENPRLVYVADRGMEVEGPAFHFVHPEAVQCRSAIEAVGQRLMGLPLLYPEIAIESRTLALAIDASRCPGDAAEEIANIVAALVPETHADLKASRHHARFEIRPRVSWGFREAMEWVYGRLKGTDAAIVAVGGEEVANAVAGSIHLGGEQRDGAGRPGGLVDVPGLLSWLLERWQERLDSMASSWGPHRARPSLALKETTPILNVRLRRAAMDRRRAANG
ncbi:Trehalose-phosphatase [Aquisphaera giovannonii]|uniref:Trehalose-phosphatase n=1 Tax=Aquisphaera giovannonii TaxID=406548 RepID=A0A5B9VZY2_9BACT|nr:trehalose-phosphatase [Aquisphaera giovannonii]QEH33868.1 Trehalose-phosphatase [Aquisphaera giovannonii]